MEKFEPGAQESLESNEGNESIEKALNWIEENTDNLEGVSVYGEMDSSRPNIDTLYVAWNGGYGEDSVLTVEYHNGLGDEAQVDSVKINDPSMVKNLVERFNVDGVPSVCSVDKLKGVLESHLDN